MLHLLKTIPVTHKMTEFIASLKLITFYWCMFFFTCPCWLTCTAVNEGWMILQVHLAKITLVKRPFRNSAGSWGEFQILTKIWDFCMDFEPYFKVHSLISVHPKSIILGQMTNIIFNMIFHVVVSVYRFIKIWNLPQFPAEFRNRQLVCFFDI